MTSVQNATAESKGITPIQAIMQRTSQTLYPHCVWAYQISIVSYFRFFLTVVLNLSVWVESENVSRSPFPRFSPPVSFIWGLDSYLTEKSTRNEMAIEKMKGEKKQNVGKVKKYYKESDRGEKVRRRDRGEWQMGPKKRGLLGSALRQSWAYDSFTVGSVCVCSLMCACILAQPFVCISGYECVRGHAHTHVRVLARRQCLPTAFSVLNIARGTVPPPVILSCFSLSSPAPVIHLHIDLTSGKSGQLCVCVCVCVGVACLL